MNRLIIHPRSMRLSIGEERNRLVLGRASGLRLSVAKQGPAGPPGTPGTGVSHLEPRIAALEASAVVTGEIDW